jgi:hypothetical protein
LAVFEVIAHGARRELRQYFTDIGTPGSFQLPLNE